MDKLRLVKSTLPAGLSTEIDRLDAMLKGLAKQQPTTSAAAPMPAGR
jgi:replicative DNA helicase